jgi:hypothetical protein
MNQAGEADGHRSPATGAELINSSWWCHWTNLPSDLNHMK